MNNQRDDDTDEPEQPVLKPLGVTRDRGANGSADAENGGKPLRKQLRRGQILAVVIVAVIVAIVIFISTRH